MKKYNLILLLLCLLPFTMYGQSYNDLWLEVNSAAKKDMPRTELDWLKKISNKATREKNYGQLMSAELMCYSIRDRLEPDSVNVIRMQYKQCAMSLRTSNPVLAAVYFTVLNDKEHALENMDALASTKDESYVPLVEVGVSSDIFNHDMLHVVGLQLEAPGDILPVYKKQNNRRAVFILEMINLAKNEDTFFQRADSLIYANRDLEESVWAANLRAKVTDDIVEQVCYIDSILETHPDNIYSNLHRNRLADLSYPKARVFLEPNVVSPQDSIRLNVDFRNIHTLKFMVQHMINDSTASEKVIYEKTAQTEFNSPYRMEEFHISLPPLPIGKYKITTIGDDYKKSIAECEVNVTSLYLLRQALPKHRYRMAVVDRISGHPVPGATVLALDEDPKKVKYRYTCDKNGEVIISVSDRHYYDYSYYPVLANDTLCPHESLNGYGHNWSVGSKDDCTVLTDRAIYRPGQTVHVAATAFHFDNKKGMQVIPQEQVGFVLYNDDHDEVDTLIAMTNDYGTAVADFTIPKDAEVGSWHVLVTSDPDDYIEDYEGDDPLYAFSVTRYFSVEEYKRPTFMVEFEKPAEGYQLGDTIIVKGKALTFSGAPVQKARVVVSGGIPEDTLTTDENGYFFVRVPIVKEREWSHDISFNAVVTDQAGESQEQKTSIVIPKGDEEKKQELIWIKGDHDVYTDKNDAIHLRYGSLFKDVNYFYSVVSDKKIVKLGQFVLSDSAEIDLPYKKEYGMGINITIAFVKDGEMHQESQMLYGPICNIPKLKITSSTFRDRLKPGAQEIWQLNISNEDGTPAAAQLAATMYDESLDPLSYYFLPGLRNFKPYIHTDWMYSYPDYDVGSLEHRYDFKSEAQLKFSHFRGSLMNGTASLTDIENIISNRDIEGTKTAKGVITGLVEDEANKDPIIGASVKIEGTDIGAVTNIDGQFTLKYDGIATLTIDYIGYRKEVAKARAGQFVHVRMKEDKSAVNEVVVIGYGVQKKSALTGTVELSKLASSEVDELKFSAPVVKKDSEVKDGEAAAEEVLEMPVVSARENFEELALWQPTLTTDSKGNVSLSFTLPETITSWHLVGWAHDKKMANGQVTATIHAMKDFVVQPNLPRFLRKGDKPVLTARIVNTCDTLQDGVVAMQLLDPATEEVMLEMKQRFRVDAHQSESASFAFDISKGSELYDKVKDGFICKMVAAGADGTSDGEQHYLPVLQDKEIVTKTIALKIRQGETKDVPVSQLVGKNASHPELEIEVTNNPMWYAVDALNTLAEPEADDVFSQLNSFYAHSVARQLGKKGAYDGIKSAAKNLEKLQEHHGAFRWFPGMEGSSYLTVMVDEQLVHLKQLVGNLDNSADKMLRKSIPVVDHLIYNEAKYLQKLKEKDMRNYWLDEEICHALYVRTLMPQAKKDTIENHIQYLLKHVIEHPSELTIYGKAMLSSVLWHRGDTVHAKQYLESIRQYAVKTPSMGIYFDTSKAKSSWYSYKLPTVSAAIEAFRNIAPDDTEMIEGMQTYLLEEKRTQKWDTNINSINAIYALLLEHLKDMKQGSNKVSVTMDGTPVEFSEPKDNAGLVTAEFKDAEASVLTFSSKGRPANSSLTGTSWGSIHAKFQQPFEDIDTVQSTGFRIHRKLIPYDEGKKLSDLKPGDKVKEIITIQAERDFDYVKVVSNRSASLEPVQQISGYNWRQGCYVSPRDSHTDYFFYRMKKGEHQFENIYYIDREGDYTSGSCYVTCEYAPVYTAYSL